MLNSSGTAQPAWDPRFGERSPLLAPFAAAAAPLAIPDWPTPDALSALAAAGGGIASGSGARVRFVAPQPAAGTAMQRYEGRIHAAGEVPTRERNWHDLFNALAWLAWPRTKAALNAAHVAAAAAEDDGIRGRRRDALTVFDESGVAVATSAPDLAALLTGFRWQELFWRARARVAREMCFFVIGHALAEKALAPFVGMTGHAILLDVTPEFFAASGAAQRAAVDGLLAGRIAGGMPATPRELAPLPVLGVPGWWAENEEASFYDNTQYFRPGRRAQPSR